MSAAENGLTPPSPLLRRLPEAEKSRPGNRLNTAASSISKISCRLIPRQAHTGTSAKISGSCQGGPHPLPPPPNANHAQLRVFLLSISNPLICNGLRGKNDPPHSRCTPVQPHATLFPSIAYQQITENRQSAQKCDTISAEITIKHLPINGLGSELTAQQFHCIR